MGNDETFPSFHAHPLFVFALLPGNLSQSTFPVTVNPKRLGRKMKKRLQRQLKGEGWDELFAYCVLPLDL